MSKYQLTTTMHARGYEQYGKNMINSFLEHWPKAQTLVVYVEGFELTPEHAADPRIISRDLLACSPELVEFKQRHRDNPAANGFRDPTRKDADFIFDAVRFSHKVFALYHAVHNRLPTADAVVWIDADTVTHRTVPQDFLNKRFPLDPGVGIYYLGRTQQHSECGWMVFNCKNHHMKAFWKQFVNQYRQDLLFGLEEWHDSYVFDHVRTQMEKSGMVNSNITPGYARGHPFVDSFLGDHMDHLKGPKRKAAGRSAKHEVRNNTAGWWQ